MDMNRWLVRRFLVLSVYLGLMGACFLSSILFPDFWDVLQKATDPNRPSQSTQSNPQTNSVTNVPIGQERAVGELAITVTRVLRPADDFLTERGLSPASKNAYVGSNRELLLVIVKIRCIDLNGCSIRANDFGMMALPGMDYAPISAERLPELSGLISDGIIGADKSLEGGLIYAIDRTSNNLTLFYPRSAAGAWTTFTVTSD
jgi:hypothetical protein